MLHQFSRNELAYGEEGTERLRKSTVLILGIGGVGSFTAEALARTGVGRLILIDKDDVDITNVNRQIIALLSTIGRPKVEIMQERIRDINPECEVIPLKMFYTEETYEQIFDYGIDFVVDACDTIKYKIHIIKECLKRNIPVISSMGAANKTDPTRFTITDISKTYNDPIAKVIRSQLRNAGIKKGVPVVFSDEIPVVARDEVVQYVGKPDASIRKAKMPPASNAYCPSVAGLFMASYVVNQLTKDIKVFRANEVKEQRALQRL